ncbi:hypothetical protein CWI42_080950 [Ordospora colligata]|uniref:Uncharacterized protein n=1 Tax=Ordospora colligata OC4 TaxID=1354746 RepID=A0A0B2UJG2_9MICR|nr:uncharacterized protein M896_080950 [Ordospora colligata OC4]KHN69359.1 hypothetical protein M896_080950 [Ordospora colligata OC4]TBU14873.1 hypothetical protein CWI41_080940 [Ordospora colligata]TBU15004.1 hypothetical protein CWI40_080960 [Ordospora colligata]TBU18258.1 hypothetical protein CWI42_080950 [Ordospora colligata]
MKKLDEAHDLEITKILAKVMQCSYKKKQVNEIISRIMQKIETVINLHDNNQSIESLRSEFVTLKQEAYSLMKP